MLFGASVHPYRKDAVAELERCVAAGAVLLEMAAHRAELQPGRRALHSRSTRRWPTTSLPLLSHTGGEKSLPNLDNVAGPAPARAGPQARRHGHRRPLRHPLGPGEPTMLPTFMRMSREYEHFYGDTAALNLPTRSYAFTMLLADDARPRQARPRQRLADPLDPAGVASGPASEPGAYVRQKLDAGM